MLRQQIIGLYRAGASAKEIAESLGIAIAVVEMALEAQGGSTTARAVAREEMAAENAEEDVTSDEAKEMADIIKGFARDASLDPHARLSAAKYIYGVRAGYHKRHLDLNVNAGDLFNRIADAYALAEERASAALTAPAQKVEITVEPIKHEGN
jgi:hypothetical protein